MRTQILQRPVLQSQKSTLVLISIVSREPTRQFVLILFPCALRHPNRHFSFSDYQDKNLFRGSLNIRILHRRTEPPPPPHTMADNHVQLHAFIWFIKNVFSLVVSAIKTTIALLPSIIIHRAILLSAWNCEVRGERGKKETNLLKNSLIT